jgi:hypothetical protein
VGADEAGSVETGAALGEGEAGTASVVRTSVAVAADVAVSSGAAHPAKIELARSRLPVTDVINLSASRREILPSE